MTRQWYVAHQVIVTPSGVPATAPLETTLLTGDNYVNWVSWRFPPGPAGCLAVSFWHGEARILPWVAQDQVITGDDETVKVNIQNDVFGQFDIYTYNTGTYRHSVMVTVEYQPISVTLANATAPVPSLLPFHPLELLVSEPIEAEA